MNRDECRSIFAVMMAVVVVATIDRDAFAAPSATYDPTTGSLQLSNDASAAALYFDSTSLTAYSSNTGDFAVLPNLPSGVVFDAGDLPRGFAFLNLPAGNYDLGNVVIPNTSLADLQLFSYASLTGSVTAGTIEDLSSGLRMQSVYVPEKQREAGPSLDLLGSGPNQITTPPVSASPTPVVPKPTYDPFANSDKSAADTAVVIALTHRTRPVSKEEIGAGAPEGYVNEFFVTSSTDIVDIRRIALDVPVYQHEYGLDNRAPGPSRLDLFPGLSADSFLDTPGQTSVLGGFTSVLEHSDAIWYDRAKSGAQDEFLFARLTVAETGNFSGAVSVAGPNGRVELPFSFALPGKAEDLALLDEEPKFSSTDQSAAAALNHIPEPSSLALVALVGALWAAGCHRNQKPWLSNREE